MIKFKTVVCIALVLKHKINNIELDLKRVRASIL